MLAVRVGESAGLKLSRMVVRISEHLTYMVINHIDCPFMQHSLRSINQERSLPIVANSFVPKGYYRVI